MRILLFGKDGQLGRELHRYLLPLAEIVAVDKVDVDFTDIQSLINFLQSVEPTIIVNAAAYTQVDRAESEPELTHQINAVAPGRIAEQAARLGAVLIHYSTDYVFDGTKGAPYHEDDVPNPLSVYGQSKLEGERLILSQCETSFVLRTSWLYGDQETSFPWKVLDWAHTQETVRVVDDQIGSPTWSCSLAESTIDIIEQIRSESHDWSKEHSGVYHAAGRGSVSRFDWAKSVINLDPDRLNQTMKALVPAKSHDFPTLAKRPKFSALDCSKVEQTFGMVMLGWEDALKVAMEVDD